MTMESTQSMAESTADLAGVGRDQQRVTTRLAQAVRYGQSTRDGCDPSGAIMVLLHDDGTASDIRLATDWRQRLGHHDVGAAVVSADANAAQRRATATAEELVMAMVGTDPSTMDAEAASPDRAGATALPTMAGRPRTLGELTNAVWSALDDLNQAAAPLPEVTGHGGGDAIRLSLCRGRIQECAIDRRWLDDQDDTTLAHALREALLSARAAQALARRPAAEFRRRLESVIADVHATLSERTLSRPS